MSSKLALGEPMDSLYFLDSTIKKSKDDRLKEILPLSSAIVQRLLVIFESSPFSLQAPWQKSELYYYKRGYITFVFLYYCIIAREMRTKLGRILKREGFHRYSEQGKHLKEFVVVVFPFWKPESNIFRFYVQLLKVCNACNVFSVCNVCVFFLFKAIIVIISIVKSTVRNHFPIW